MDRGLNRDANPHLLVFWWVGWVPGVYNAGRWVQVSGTLVPGMILPVGATSYAGYVYWGGNWWGWWNKQWVGYYPGNTWNPAYVNNTLAQWFGEVYANPVPPNNQMGNGIKGSSLNPKSARMDYVCEVDSAAWICQIRAGTPDTVPTPAWYNTRHNGNEFYFGGPGK